MKPVCIVDRDALEPEDIVKLEAEGYVVIRKQPGRYCEVWLPPMWNGKFVQSEGAD